MANTERMRLSWKARKKALNIRGISLATNVKGLQSGCTARQAVLGRDLNLVHGAYSEAGEDTTKKPETFLKDQVGRSRHKRRNNEKSWNGEH